MIGDYDDDEENPVNYEAVSGTGSASTLNVTRAEGDELPKGNPIGFIWPEPAAA